MVPVGTICVATGQAGAEIGADMAPTQASHRADTETYVTHSLRGEGFDASEDGTGGGTPLVPVSFRTAGDGGVYEEGDLTAPLTTGTDPSAQLIAFSSKDHGADAESDLAPTLRAGTHDGSHANGGVPPAIAYSIMPQNSGKDYKAREVDVAQPVMAGGPVGGNQGGDYIVQPVPIDMRQASRGEGFDASEDGTGRGTPIVPVAFQECVTGVREYADAGTLRAGGPGHDPVGTRLRIGSAVRRLTPRECERLQGFADDYTLLPSWAKGAPKADIDEVARWILAGDPAWLYGKDDERAAAWERGLTLARHPDGPRYKALGNSMATPCMAYIASRIIAVEASSTEAAA